MERKSILRQSLKLCSHVFLLNPLVSRNVLDSMVQDQIGIQVDSKIIMRQSCKIYSLAFLVNPHLKSWRLEISKA